MAQGQVQESLVEALASPAKAPKGSKAARRERLETSFSEECSLTRGLRERMRAAIASAGPDVPKVLKSEADSALRVQELKARVATVEALTGTLVSAFAAIIMEGDKHPEALRVVEQVLACPLVQVGVAGGAMPSPAAVTSAVGFTKLCLRCGYPSHTADAPCTAARHVTGRW